VTTKEKKKKGREGAICLSIERESAEPQSCSTKRELSSEDNLAEKMGEGNESISQER